MFVLLMVLTALLALVFFLALARYLWQISDTLSKIGGAPDSYLAKLRLGLRAIETETSAEILIFYPALFGAQPVSKF